MKRKSIGIEISQQDIDQNFMEWRELFVEILNREFGRQKSRNSKLSMRQWAKRIGVSSGAVSELLTGQRKLTPEKALEIAKAAKVPATEISRLLAHMGKPPKVKRISPKKEEADLIRDWVNHAIAGLYELNAVTVNDELIAHRLRLPNRDIALRTEKLLAAGILKKDSAGKVFRERENWDLSTLYSPEELRKTKEESISFAQKSFRQSDPQKSVFINATFPGNLSHIKFIREEIMKVLDSIDALVDSEPKDELIRFSIQAFPFNFTEE